MSTRAISIAMDEEKAVLFISNTSVVKYKQDCFSEKPLEQLCTASYSKLCLGKDGNHLVIYNDLHTIKVYDIDNLIKPLYTKKWPNYSAETTCSFSTCGDLLVSIQNVLFKYDKKDIWQQPLKYECITEFSKSRNWSETGHIWSVTHDDNTIYVLYEAFKPAQMYLVSLDARNLTLKRETILPDAKSYTSVVYVKNVGMCIQSAFVGHPMLVYDPISNNLLRQIQLPPALKPAVTENGKLLTFRSFSELYPPYSAFLVDTDTWKIKMFESDNAFYDVAFSSKDQYWLLAGKRSKIVDLKSMKSYLI